MTLKCEFCFVCVIFATHKVYILITRIYPAKSNKTNTEIYHPESRILPTSLCALSLYQLYASTLKVTTLLDFIFINLLLF